MSIREFFSLCFFFFFFFLLTKLWRTAGEVDNYKIKGALFIPFCCAKVLISPFIDKIILDIPVLQIRRGKMDNLGIIFHIIP